MNDVFLSYSHMDKSVADAICALLEELGISYFRDSASIDLGDSITGEVQAALNGCMMLVVIVSPASVKSLWVPYEIGRATALDKKVIPFLTHRALALPLYMSDLSNTADIEVLRDHIAAFHSKCQRMPAIRSPWALDDTQTERLLRMHQASIANHIARAIDHNLQLIADDANAFDSESFFQDVRAAILKGRALCVGFYSRSLGDLSKYIEQRFPENELRQNIEKFESAMLKVGDSRVKRHQLFERVATIQEMVFSRALDDIRNSRKEANKQ
ncbi:MAG: toll/interleukin-1 receptor domain-containing protein [Limisphaerales bacterium]